MEQRVVLRLCPVLALLLVSVSSTELDNKMSGHMTTVSTNETQGNSTAAGLLQPPQVCSGQCHSQFQLPCDCDGACVIFNNCCPDIDVSCSNARPFGRISFAVDVLFVDFTCDPAGYYSITSCKRDITSIANMGTTRKIWTVDDLPLSLRQAMSVSERSLQKNSLNHVLANVPMTDSIHRLSYANFSIFQCSTHRGATLDIWRTVIALDKDPLQENSEITIDEVKHFWYLPPMSVQHLIFLCIADAVVTCNESVDSNLRWQCESGLQYYVSVVGEKRVFRNIACALCNGVLSRNLEPVSTWPFSPNNNHSLSIEIEISFSNNKLQLKRVSRGISEDGTVVAWRQAACRQSQKEQQNGLYSLQCVMGECEPTYDLINGRCLLGHSIRLAFELGSKVSHRSLPLDRLADVVLCIVKSMGHTVASHVTVSKERLDTGENMLFVNFLSYFKTRKVFPPQNSEDPYKALREVEIIGTMLRMFIAAFDTCKQRIDHLKDFEPQSTKGKPFLVSKDISVYRDFPFRIPSREDPVEPFHFPCTSFVSDDDSFEEERWKHSQSASLNMSSASNFTTCSCWISTVRPSRTHVLLCWQAQESTHQQLEKLGERNCLFTPHGLMDGDVQNNLASGKFVDHSARVLGVAIAMWSLGR